MNELQVSIILKNKKTMIENTGDVSVAWKQVLESRSACRSSRWKRNQSKSAKLERYHQGPRVALINLLDVAICSKE